MSEAERDGVLRRIRDNIKRYRCHIYLIKDGQHPRFAYTIGLSEQNGCELIFAGGAYYDDQEVKCIINELVNSFSGQVAWENAKIDLKQHGQFSFQRADDSWVGRLALGAFDYYQQKSIPAYQIVPDDLHSTIDVPDLSRRRAPESDLPWRWLYESWDYPVPLNSMAITNMTALRGGQITEAARWESDQWELFSGPGPEIPKHEVRAVPLGTLLAVDPTLEQILKLGVGEAAWRDNGDSHWHEWQ